MCKSVSFGTVYVQHTVSQNAMFFEVMHCKNVSLVAFTCNLLCRTRACFSKWRIVEVLFWYRSRATYSFWRVHAIQSGDLQKCLQSKVFCFVEVFLRYRLRATYCFSALHVFQSQDLRKRFFGTRYVPSVPFTCNGIRRKIIVMNWKSVSLVRAINMDAAKPNTKDNGTKMHQHSMWRREGYQKGIEWEPKGDQMKLCALRRLRKLSRLSTTRPVLPHSGCSENWGVGVSACIHLQFCGVGTLSQQT